MMIEDLLSEKKQFLALRTYHTIKQMNTLVKETGHSRFPVVDEWNRVIGVVTPKDTIGADMTQTIDKVMTRNPHVVQPHTTIAAAAHMIAWEGIELLPVVDHNRKLVAVIGRQDVLRAMQYSEMRPQTGETFEDMIWSSFESYRQEDGQLRFRGVVQPQMTSHLGTVHEGVLVTIMVKAAYHTIKEHKKGDLILDNISTYFVRPLQIESEVIIVPNIIEISRKFGKIEVALTHQENLICKAMLTAQVIEN